MKYVNNQAVIYLFFLQSIVYTGTQKENG